jgi:heme/copper-type cytochrome/quinol oxidase subunit 2
MADRDIDGAAERPKRGLISFAVAVVAITLVVVAGLIWLVWDYAALQSSTHQESP